MRHRQLSFIPEEMRCSKCRQVKAIAEFDRDKQKSTGRCPTCKVCRNKWRNAPENQAICAERHKRWRDKNPEKVKAMRRRSYHSHKETHKNRCLQKKYDITLEQYIAILKSQNGVCAICCGIERTGKQLAVDHCHKTKKIRGLLCSSCNNALGRFKDNPNTLIAAANYLMKGGVLSHCQL